MPHGFEFMELVPILTPYRSRFCLPGSSVPIPFVDGKEPFWCGPAVARWMPPVKERKVGGVGEMRSTGILGIAAEGLSRQSPFWRCEVGAFSSSMARPL